MKKLFCLLALFCCLSVSIFAQDLQKRAEENPLDCVLYLTKTENYLKNRDDNLVRLADLYWKSGRREKALEVVELNRDYNKRVVSFISFARELKTENKIKEFEELYLKAFAILKENDDFGTVWKGGILVEVIKTLTELNHAQEVLEVVNEANSEEDDKAYILLAVADGFLAIKQNEKALELIPTILQYAKNSKWKDLELLAKAKAGTIYLKAGNDKESKKLYEEVLKSSSSIKEIENIFVDDLWREVFDGYKSANRFSEAIETLVAYQQTNTLNSKESYINRDLSETYLANDQKEKAISLMRQMIADDDGYNSLWAAETFLKLEDENSAKNIFLTTQREYYKQKIALKLAKYYQGKGKIEFAVNILNLAFNEAKKIKSDEPESGMMSTSPAMEKASYMRDISQKLIELKRFDSALKTIQAIEKPYFKAQMLAVLAEKQHSKDSIQLLNQALLIMRKTENSSLDAEKYQVWSEIAVAYTNIGQKNKALGVFAEILSTEKEIREAGSDNHLLDTLAEVGYYFEKSGLKADVKVRRALRQIIKNWGEEN